MLTKEKTGSVLEETSRDTIRAKWVMDGATDLFEAALALTTFARSLLDLHDQGWRLEGPVTDDYGFISKTAEPYSCDFPQVLEVWNA